jgi:hypothetical protein
MEARRRHRLTGLEPDNVLAFLALLGLLRALEAWVAVRPTAGTTAPPSVGSCLGRRWPAPGSTGVPAVICWPP